MFFKAFPSVPRAFGIRASIVITLVTVASMVAMDRMSVLADDQAAVKKTGTQDAATPTRADRSPAPAKPSSQADSLAAELAKPILGEGDVIAALSRYTMDRLPPAPRATDADQWLRHSEQLRRRVLDEVMFRGRAAAWRDAPVRVEWKETIPGGLGYTIRKLRYEAAPGMWIPAVVYMPNQIRGKVPAVLNFHGHAHDDGFSYPPKQVRCINQAKRGIIAMSPDWLWTGQLKDGGYSHERCGLLDLCGASGLAPFYLSMSRAMDVLVSMPEVDASRVAVTGLSGGGWQTIIFGALDTRAAIVAPNAGYASVPIRIEHHESLGDYEQAPCDMAAFCDYTHLTAMVAPRPLLVISNIRDNCCFAADVTLAPVVDAALPIYRLLGKTRYCQWHVNYDPGTHNYERDNREAFYRMVNEFFFAGDDRPDPTEIPCDSEIKSLKDLSVDLPKDNATFQTLAAGLMADLPRDAAPPADAAARGEWIKKRRAALGEVIRFAELPAEGEPVGEPVAWAPSAAPSEGDLAEPSSARIQRWKLLMGPYWTVPAVEIAPSGKPTETVVLLADRGRAGQRDRIAELVGSGRRVLTVDHLLIGEQNPKHRFHSDRFGMLVQSTGGRVLGIGAAQVAAAADWAKKQYGVPVVLETVGPRTSLVGLVAAAVRPGLVDQVQTREPLATLKDVVRRNWEFFNMPEATCYGLLEVVDMEQLRVLAESP